MWLAKVREQTGQEIAVDWQPFSLSQVNNKEEVKVWDLPGAVDGSDPTLLAHKAGLSAKRQGREVFEAYFMALLKLRHEEKADLNDQAVIEAAATTAGLDMARFREDIADPDLLRELAESHTKAVEEYGAFGVPTFVFDNGSFAFLKMFIPPDEQAVEIYESLTKTMSEFVHVGELKRPQPPWPHGVI